MRPLNKSARAPLWSARRPHARFPRSRRAVPSYPAPSLASRLPVGSGSGFRAAGRVAIAVRRAARARRAATFAQLTRVSRVRVALCLRIPRRLLRRAAGRVAIAVRAAGRVAIAVRRAARARRAATFAQLTRVPAFAARRPSHPALSLASRCRSGARSRFAQPVRSGSCSRSRSGRVRVSRRFRVGTGPPVYSSSARMRRSPSAHRSHWRLRLALSRSLPSNRRPAVPSGPSRSSVGARPTVC